MFKPGTPADKHLRNSKHFDAKLTVETLEAMILLSGSCGGLVAHAVGEHCSDANVETDQCDAYDTTLHHTSNCSGNTTHFDPFCEPAPTHCKPVAYDCAADKPVEPPASDDFDSILEWNDVMLEANAADHARTRPEQGGPILTARAFAIVSAAMYDAYNSVEHIGSDYLVKAPFTNGANSDAAVAQAAYQALVELFPSQRDTFDSELKESLARIADGASEDLGRAVGKHVADQILATRELDNYEKLNSVGKYVPNGKPGFHDVDPLNPNQGFYGAGAMEINPFAIESVDQFQSAPLDDGTPEGRLAFMQSEKYRLAYEEVKALGGDGITTPTTRTAEQTEIGKYWGYDGRPDIGTPPRLYNQIVRHIAEQEDNTEAENARLFALVNISMADAGITSWNTKYDDAFWRPILGVRGGDNDGNPDTIGDAEWRPLGAPASNPRAGETNFTPNFPAYTSGHATFGAATFQTLARFYGTDNIHFTFVSDELNGKTIDADGSIRPLVERSFSSLTEAKVENAQSRIYLGIHWAFDATDGIKMGDAVADFVFDNVLKTNSSPRVYS
ncbi:MAG: phosphatase PAP2 family protein [Pirellulaceae bacterium]|nr:phosphatase PAP2 family protein [Pirellulaceae bacterium]